MNKTVLVITEFSHGNLSFEQQRGELQFMVEAMESDLYAESINNDKEIIYNVIFVGHSMGGVASINYAIDYANKNDESKVKIITVSTPYYPNNYAELVDNLYEFSGSVYSPLLWILSKAAFKAGESHADLGGNTFAYSLLQNKWNTFIDSLAGKNTKLSAIAIKAESIESLKKSILKNYEDLNQIIDGMTWFGKATMGVDLYLRKEQLEQQIEEIDSLKVHESDYIVEFKSQLAIVPSNATYNSNSFHNYHPYKEVSRYIINGTDVCAGGLQILEFAKLNSEYHHINTPDLQSVIDQIQKLVKD